jgi:hypothetical protein
MQLRLAISILFTSALTGALMAGIMAGRHLRAPHPIPQPPPRLRYRPPAASGPANDPGALECVDFREYADIVGAGSGYLVTCPLINKWGQDGIGFFNAVTGRCEWRQPSVAEGRYTRIMVADGGTRFVECTGYPRENHLAVRRVADGHILGRPWTVGEIRDFEISGGTVAVILVRWLGEREIHWVCLYDDWGRVVRRLPIADAESLCGLTCGFAVVSKNRTTLITDTGRRLLSLH